MKKIYLLLSLILAYATALSQSLSPVLIGSAGGQTDNATYQTSWSIGEAITATVEASSCTVTQGFQQGFSSPSITGLIDLCVSSGYYYYTTQAGMTAYTWTVSSGGTIIYGAGTNQVEIVWSTPGAKTVTVNYTNLWGYTPAVPTTLSITVKPLPDPAGTITGPNNVCAGTNGITYSIAPIVNAVTYAWTLPPGATITNGSETNVITVDFAGNASSGNIIVNGNNLCGNGASSPAYPITVKPQPPAPVISSIGNTLYSSATEGNQWYYNGTAIPGGTSQTLVAEYSGLYYDVVTINGCSSDISNVLDIIVTGIPMVNKENMKIYPVPNNGQFNIFITSTSFESYVINIYNCLGTMVYEERNIEINGSLDKVVDIRSVPDGIYTVIISNDQNRVVRKIVVRN